MSMINCAKTSRIMNDGEFAERLDKKLKEWKENHDYWKPCYGMGLDKLRGNFFDIEKERDRLTKLSKELGHSIVDERFFSLAIMELDRLLKNYSDEIRMAERLKNYVECEDFDIVKVLCSKKMTDLIDKIGKHNGMTRGELSTLIKECAIQEFEKLRYDRNKILDLITGVDGHKDNEDEKEHEAEDTIKGDHDKQDSSATEIDSDNKPMSEQEVAWDGEFDDDDKQTDTIDDIDDPSCYWKSLDEDKYSVNTTDDIIDWGNIKLNGNAKKQFEVYGFADKVPYGDYVDSVTVNYEERELFIEIEDPNNEIIPLLVNYWEDLYHGAKKPVDEDIIVRTNAAKKSFETFKNCGIIDFGCSSYTKGSMPRRATLRYSFEKAVTEYC